MSRIITSLACSHCNHIKPTYISFGHPDNDFEYKWNCENCGQENTETVKAWIDMSNQDCGDTVIYEDDSTTTVRIFDSHMTFIPCKKFQWNLFEDEQMAECFTGYLTLDEISAQIKKVRNSEHIGVIYVWVESPLYGVIYEYGNYPGGRWRVHGKTKGYA